MAERSRLRSLLRPLRWDRDACVRGYEVGAWDGIAILSLSSSLLPFLASPPLPSTHLSTRHKTKMHALLPLTALLTTTALARSTVLEHLPSTPSGWHSLGAAAPDTTLHFRIAMAQPDEGLFEQTLMDVSDPESVRYGRHLKLGELKEMLKPRSEASEGVREWLSGAGVEEVEDDGEWVDFWATVERAEDLLDTKFEVFRNERLGVG